MDELPLHRQTVDDIIRLLMRIDARLEELSSALGGEDDDEEPDT